MLPAHSATACLTAAQCCSVILRLAGGRGDGLITPIPLRIVARNRWRSNGKGVTAVKLIWPAAGRLQALARDGLKGGRGDDTDEVGKVRAATSAAQQFFHLAAKSGTQGEADQLFVIWRDRVAVPDVGHRIGGGFGIDDGEGAVDGNAQPHRMNRFSGHASTAGDVEVHRFGVVKVAFDIEHAVIALVASNADVAMVQGLAWCGCAEGHGDNLSLKRQPTL